MQMFISLLLTRLFSLSLSLSHTLIVHLCSTWFWWPLPRPVWRWWTSTRPSCLSPTYARVSPRPRARSSSSTPSQTRTDSCCCERPSLNFIIVLVILIVNAVWLCVYNILLWCWLMHRNQHHIIYYIPRRRYEGPVVPLKVLPGP